MGENIRSSSIIDDDHIILMKMYGDKINSAVIYFIDGKVLESPGLTLFRPVDVLPKI